MSNGRRKSFWERFAYKELSKIGPSTSASVERLSADELSSIRKIRRSALLQASFAGATGVLLLYIPYHVLTGSVFPKRELFVPFGELKLTVEYEFYAYSLLLVLIEIWFLNYLNVKTVAKIARACGFPEEIDDDYENNLSALIAVGLEKKHKQLQSIGINPYLGLSKWKLLAYQVAIRFKAALTNYAFKLVISRLLGRYLLRVYIDLIGIPVYAFWNAYATHRIIKEALVRIMAPPIIKKFADSLFEFYGQNEQVRSIIYDSLQSISESKRSYHYNHFLLSISLLNKFNVPVNEQQSFNPEIHRDLRTADEVVRKSFSKILVFGIVIDGKVSKREIRLLEKMQSENIVPYSTEEIKSWAADFSEGKGLDSLINN